MQSDIVQRLRKYAVRSNDGYLRGPALEAADEIERNRAEITRLTEAHAAGYQQAIADVVEWLHSENGLCDCFARSATECSCGAWDDYKEWPLERTAQEITRRFGKDA